MWTHVPFDAPPCVEAEWRHAALSVGALDDVIHVAQRLAPRWRPAAAVAAAGKRPPRKELCQVCNYVHSVRSRSSCALCTVLCARQSPPLSRAATVNKPANFILTHYL